MATITWRNLNAPQLQTNFQDNSLKGFNDLFSGLAQQNQFAKEKERADATEALKSSFFNYTGPEGAQALDALRSSGQFGEMMGALGNKVDQNAVREALLGTQNRLGQENQRAQLQTERDRLLAQKPYVDAVDLLVSKGDLAGAKAYATGLNQQGVLDNDFASKVFGVIGSAETAAQDTSTRQALAKINLGKVQKAEQNDALVNNLMSKWETAARAPEVSGEFYGMSTPQYAAEAKKRENAISNVISQTFGVPLNERGVLDTSKLSGAALDAYNKMYADQLSNLQVPKPTSSISERTQAFRQAALAQGVPVDVVSQFDKTLQERLSLEAPRAIGADANVAASDQAGLNARKNKLDAITEDTKRTLSKSGLSGITLNDTQGLDPVIKKLKDLGMSPDAKDTDAQDRYSYVMELLATPDYENVDTNVVNKIIDKVVGSRAGKFDIANWDRGYRDDIKKALDTYVASKDYTTHKNAILGAREKVNEASTDFFDARLKALHLKPK